MSEQKVVKATAPGKVILFGEHAVVYDKLGLAVSIGKSCYVTVEPNEENKVSIEIKNLGMEKSLTEKELFELFDLTDRLKREKKFDEIKYLQSKEKLNAPFFVIASLMKKYGFKPVKIITDSDVPKNLGSGSSAFSCISLALAKYLGADLDRKEVSDLAFEGDVVAHGGTPSGIDNSIVTYGGYIQYKKSEGVKPLEIDFEFPLIFVDSGEPAMTADTVPYIRKQREYSKDFVDNILDNLDKITAESLESLKEKDLRKIGKLMFDYYNELKKLNISTDRIDDIIKIAVDNEALGAKPTGGWGGGCCIVLAKDSKHANKLVSTYKNNGFNAFQTKIGVEGVRVIE